MGAVDLFLITNREKVGDFDDFLLTLRALIERDIAGIDASGDVGFLADGYEVGFVIIGVVVVDIVTNGHWHSKELLFEQVHLGSTVSTPIIECPGFDFGKNAHN